MYIPIKQGATILPSSSYPDSPPLSNFYFLESTAIHRFKYFYEGSLHKKLNVSYLQH